MRALKSFTAILFLLGFGLFAVGNTANTARAEIPIELPRTVSAEDLAKIIEEEVRLVHGLAVEIEIRHRYKLGSVVRLPHQIIIHIKKDDCTFLSIPMWKCGDGFDYLIELVPGKSYTLVNLVQKRKSWRVDSPLTTANFEWHERLQALEELMKRVGERINQN